MTEKTINCENCSVEFTFEENPKYPRKYCLNCSAKKKQEWDGKGDQKYSKGGYGAPIERPEAPKTSKEYHLSPEQVRSNALSSAIEWSKRDAEREVDIDIRKLAEKFVKWINGGGD